MSATIIQFPRSRALSRKHQVTTTPNRVEQLEAELNAVLEHEIDNSSFVRTGKAAIDELFAAAFRARAQIWALKKHLNNTRARYS